MTAVGNTGLLWVCRGQWWGNSTVRVGFSIFSPYDVFIPLGMFSRYTAF